MVTLERSKAVAKQLFACILPSDELAIEKRDMGHRISWLPGTFLMGGVAVLQKSGELGPRYGAGQTVYHAMCGVSMHQVDGASYSTCWSEHLGLHRTIAVEKES